ncbi:tetratricopeptide repeat protein [Thalassoroseus pseudoceratinae]|uniref:tetratricopeptide repeat protein n=1 Tax=Thalassoroseus pseudoceratinae TaxID=2713176 RepID=UPI001424386A|nr:tetratricopeptide repeat protein [Thalassoroseus pseudoceratinae]
MIIYGSRMYGKKQQVKTFGSCDHCGAYGQQFSYFGRKFGHIYFIPLIPMGGRVRVLFQCAKCDMGSHVPEDEVPNLTRGITEAMKPAIAAVNDGHDTFVDADGDTVHAGAQLAGPIVTLHACGLGESVQKILEVLPSDSQAYHLVDAADLAVIGHDEEAIDSYKKAISVKAEDPVPLQIFGEFCANTGRLPLARQVYEKALRLAPNNVAVVARLADIAEGMKDYEGICDRYEQLFELQPSLLQQKKLVKTYKKACKKAQREPVALR